MKKLHFAGIKCHRTAARCIASFVSPINKRMPSPGICTKLTSGTIRNRSRSQIGRDVGKLKVGSQFHIRGRSGSSRITSSLIIFWCWKLRYRTPSLLVYFVDSNSVSHFEIYSTNIVIEITIGLGSVCPIAVYERSSTERIRFWSFWQRTIFTQIHI